VDTSGTAINGAALKEAIRRGQIVTVHRGSDGTHPTLVVEKVENPADAGSSLTLDALKDVAAPASTAAGMFLGTTGVGAWGPVANPTAGVWAGKTRTSRPNSTDRLLEVWDGAAWVPVYYDSGLREVSAVAQLTAGKATIRRIGSVVRVEFEYAVRDAGIKPWLTEGFQPPVEGSLTSGVAVNSAAAVPFGPYGNDIIPQAAPAWSSLCAQIAFYTSQPVPYALPGTLISPAP
jgi:hypothetical protein